MCEVWNDRSSTWFKMKKANFFVTFLKILLEVRTQAFWNRLWRNVVVTHHVNNMCMDYKSFFDARKTIGGSRVTIIVQTLTKTWQLLIHSLSDLVCLLYLVALLHKSFYSSKPKKLLHKIKNTTQCVGKVLINKLQKYQTI